MLLENSRLRARGRRSLRFFDFLAGGRKRVRQVGHAIRHISRFAPGRPWLLATMPGEQMRRGFSPDSLRSNLFHGAASCGSVVRRWNTEQAH
jgi:hypothetical protein